MQHNRADVAVPAKNSAIPKPKVPKAKTYKLNFLIFYISAKDSIACFSDINLNFKRFFKSILFFYKLNLTSRKFRLLCKHKNSSVVKRLSRILDMDESAVQLCAELPTCFSSVVKRLSHILHMDGSAVQLCPELPICFQYNDLKQSNNLAPCVRGRQKVSGEW